MALCFPITSAHGLLNKVARARWESARQPLLRVFAGIVAGGGRIDKPLLKAGAAYHKYKAKRNCWPKVRGVAMNVSTMWLLVGTQTRVFSLRKRMIHHTRLLLTTNKRLFLIRRRLFSRRAFLVARPVFHVRFLPCSPSSIPSVVGTISTSVRRRPSVATRHLGAKWVWSRPEGQVVYVERAPSRTRSDRSSAVVRSVLNKETLKMWPSVFVSWSDQAQC